MNRFQPRPDRTCLEDLSAPVSHFASCNSEHDFMFRQLAQTHRREPQMDPTFWDRTANIWAGSVARGRVNLVQLAASFRGKCASAAAMVVLLLGLQVLPAPTRPAAPADPEYATPKQSNASTQAAAQATSTARPAVATKRTEPSATPQENAPAAPAHIPETRPPQPIPVVNESTPTTPNPDEPTAPSDAISVSVLADEEPLVHVSLLGISVKVL